MKIVGIHLEPGSVGWHRVWCWTEAMQSLRHDVWHRPHAGTQFEWNEIDKILDGADVVIAGRMHNMQVFAALLAGRDRYKYKLIVDTDDNSDAIPLYNQAHSDHHAAAGIPRLVHAQLREADLVTVSTLPLKVMAEQYASRVVHVPNVIDTRHYAKVRSREKEIRHRNDFRIYWGGGGGHYNDLLEAKDALLRIFHERPNVKLIFSNFLPDWAVDLPPFRCFMVRFAHFNAYPKVLKWLCADVAIAPLVDNEFNRCKSNIKYLTYAMSDIPGVYQDIEPYRCVNHGWNGLKAANTDDWYDNILALIDYPEMARRIAKAAKNDVLSRWTTNNFVGRYESMLKNLVSERPPKFSMLEEGKPVEITQWAQS